MIDDVEKLCVTYKSNKGQLWQITYKYTDRKYHLYKQNDKGEWIYTRRKADNPLKLEQYTG